MSLYKRGSVYWIRFTKPDGGELRETAQTSDRRQAQEYHDTRKAELWRVAKLGEQPRHTWKEAVVRWLEEHPDRRCLDSMLSFLRLADQTLGTLRLDEITKDRLSAMLHSYRATGVKNGTANRLIVTITAVLNAAKTWEWIDRVPKITLLPDTSRRLRWLTRDEADRLIAELPPYLAAMVRFALATGLRDQNICKLEWNQVDLDRRVAWIHADQAKGKRLITVPLNTDAVVVLREQAGQHSQWVFPCHGRAPHAASGHSWYSALKRAGLSGVRFHDLRHTWASWHVQAGTPLMALKEMGGWSNLDMVLRYAHLAPDHLAEHAERISGPRLVRTNSGTAPEKVAATG